MANSPQHINQWRHNRDFIGAIPPRFPDWIVTAAFYVALHAVDALLAHDNVQRVTSHDGRNSVLIHTNRYQNIWRHYAPLYDLSQVVRYLADPARWIPQDQIEQQVLKRYLYPIERSAQKLMGADLNLSAIQLAE